MSDPVSDPVYTHGGYIPMSRELMGDIAVVTDYLNTTFDRYVRPWRYPDPNPMPRFVLFPRLARVHRWFQ